MGHGPDKTCFRDCLLAHLSAPPSGVFDAGYADQFPVCGELCALPRPADYLRVARFGAVQHAADLPWMPPIPAAGRTHAARCQGLSELLQRCGSRPARRIEIRHHFGCALRRGGYPCCARA